MPKRTVEVGQKKVEINTEAGIWTLSLYHKKKLVDTFRASNMPFYDTRCVENWLSDHQASQCSKDTNEAILELKKELGEYH